MIIFHTELGRKSKNVQKVPRKRCILRKSKSICQLPIEKWLNRSKIGIRFSGRQTRMHHFNVPSGKSRLFWQNQHFEVQNFNLFVAFPFIREWQWVGKWVQSPGAAGKGDTQYTSTANRGDGIPLSSSEPLDAAPALCATTTQATELANYTSM